MCLSFRENKGKLKGKIKKFDINIIFDIFLMFYKN
jgi:hypothetical protein